MKNYSFILILALTLLIFRLGYLMFFIIHPAAKKEKSNPQLDLIMHSRIGFLKEMSHQLRTPLMALLGSIELLQQKNLSREEEKELLRIAHDRTVHLSNLVEEILKLKQDLKKK